MIVGSTDPESPSLAAGNVRAITAGLAASAADRSLAPGLNNPDRRHCHPTFRRLVRDAKVFWSMTPIDLTQLQSFNLDHHGIVAGIIDDIGLVDTINEEFGVQRTDSSGPQEAVSTGVAVKAMILNGQGWTLRVGFVSAPLYLFERFFEGKPTEHLLGEGVRPDPKSPSLDLSDDKLGKVLDKLHEADLTRLFVNIALTAATRHGVNLTSLHLDTSSFSVHGEYASEPSDEEGEGITHGYSRERRPDLKQ